MAIADTITSMQTHTSNAYTMIGYGTDLTGINKNLANLSSTIFEAFLEALRTPDTLFTNLPKKSGSGSNITLNDTANAPMRITLGSVPFTQDGTPTPSTPFDIHSIKGSNTLKVYGNLFDISTITENTYLDGGTGNTGTSSVTNLSDYIELKDTTDCYLDYDYTSLLNSGSRSYCFYNSSKTYISGNSYTATDKKHTITTPSNAKYIRFAYDKNCIDIKFYQTLETADVDLGEIECGSIGNYENIPIRTFGKQLFDISTITQGKYIDGVGGLIDTANSNTSDFIEVLANQSYTLTWNYTEPLNSSSRREIVLYNNNKQFIETITLVTMTNKTITFTPSQDGYIRFDYDKKCYDIMLNEGTTALPYEPYGNGTWYLKKNIGKVVLDGSENWGVHGSIASWFYADNLIDGIIDNSVTYSMYSNYYIQENYNNVANLTNGQFAYTPTGNKRLVFKNTSCSTANDFKTLLSTHNTDLYYILATPKYTPITGTLATQLENVYQKMLSQEGQTNISQINDDLSFNLSVQAIEEL